MGGTLDNIETKTAVIVAYVNSVDEVPKFWPEVKAEDVVIMQEEPIKFSDRFSKPDWWKEDA